MNTIHSTRNLKRVSTWNSVWKNLQDLEDKFLSLRVQAHIF